MNSLPNSSVVIDLAWEHFASNLLSFLKRRAKQPEDAEDALQQVFLKLTENPPATVSAERLGPWLYRVARNALIDIYRKRVHRDMPSLTSDPIAETPDDDALRELGTCVMPMLRTIPPLYAEAVVATDIEGATQTALAKSQGISVSAMKSRVQRGRAMLRTRFLECCGTPEGELECGDCD